MAILKGIVAEVCKGGWMRTSPEVEYDHEEHDDNRGMTSDSSACMLSSSFSNDYHNMSYNIKVYPLPDFDLDSNYVVFFLRNNENLQVEYYRTSEFSKRVSKSSPFTMSVRFGVANQNTTKRVLSLKVTKLDEFLDTRLRKSYDPLAYTGELSCEDGKYFVSNHYKKNVCYASFPDLNPPTSAQFAWNYVQKGVLNQNQDLSKIGSSTSFRFRSFVEKRTRPYNVDLSQNYPIQSTDSLIRDRGLRGLDRETWSSDVLVQTQAERTVLGSGESEDLQGTKLVRSIIRREYFERHKDSRILASMVKHYFNTNDADEAESNVIKDLRKLSATVLKEIIDPQSFRDEKYPHVCQEVSAALYMQVAPPDEHYLLFKDLDEITDNPFDVVDETETFERVLKRQYFSSRVRVVKEMAVAEFERRQISTSTPKDKKRKVDARAHVTKASKAIQAAETVASTRSEERAAVIAKSEELEAAAKEMGQGAWKSNPETLKRIQASADAQVKKEDAGGEVPYLAPGKARVKQEIPDETASTGFDGGEIDGKSKKGHRKRTLQEKEERRRKKEARRRRREEEAEKKSAKVEGSEQ